MKDQFKDPFEKLKEVFKNASPEKKYEIYSELKRLIQEAEEALERNAAKA